MRKTTVASLVLALPAFAACTANDDPDTKDADGRLVTVGSSDDACQVSSAAAPAGKLTFDVTNTGSEVTEFYLLAEDGLRILGEVENIGPQISRQLVVNAPAGTYMTACKPGMKGDGIRAAFTVEPSDEKVEVDTDDQQLVDQAITNYAAYVKDQSDQLVDKTTQFVTAYEAGDDDEARALYPLARVHWERIETVAESFGDLDPKMDLREADVEPGAGWTGWHRIEKDLWPQRAGADYRPLVPKARAVFADDLMKNTTTLDNRVQKLTYTVDQIANGSRGLLEEVATGKVTGEEEYWSHTDLYDFQANVDGARVGYEGVQPILEQKDPELAATLTKRFAELQALLDDQRVGKDGFKLYTELEPAEVKGLSDAVNALSEPLSKLTAAVLS